MATFSRGVEEALRQAIAMAGERAQQHATLEHLLLALVDDPDAAKAMRACNVDLGQLRRSLVEHIDNHFDGASADKAENLKPTPSADFQRAVQRAVIHVQPSGQVTGADLLVAIFAEQESHAVDILKAQGMTRFHAVNYVSHGTSPGTGAGTQPVDGSPHADYRVLIFNDDFTPMEFVVEAIQTYFEKTREAATTVMLEVHNNGVAECARFPYEVADAKVRALMAFARQHQHPLRCAMEKT
jgi:ATP-dependent Clp protease adapter protein ClpS